MKKFLIFLLLSSAVFAQYNDSIINYIFENRQVFREYFPDRTAEQLKMYNIGITPFSRPRPNPWQEKNLFADDTRIEVFYEHSEEILRSIINNRRLTRNSSFFNIIIPLIKEGREIRDRLGREAASVSLLRNVPVDILVKNQDRIRDLLDYLLARDANRWNDEGYRDEFRGFRGYALTAVLARLDNVRDYQMLNLQSREIRRILSYCGIDIEELPKTRFISAGELLRIVENCSDDRPKQRAIAFVERNASDSVINMFVNQNFSREELVANFLRDPVRYSWYVRRLADDGVISQIVPYLVVKKSGHTPSSIRGELRTDFAYFVPLITILRELYYDFDLEGKYFPPERGFYDAAVWYIPQRNNNIPFEEVYSENLLDFVRRYEKWIRNRFGVGLNRQPQPTDVIVRGRPLGR